ncbi:hypothetical protein M427DRAFT_201343 [Gonapodya prolifera JEL478]|uniref:Enoyl reductase (ER) domain-containing protein n=1 Tax=Gonapodya prolifera (strain JEL478) TaxID=1344416 RepID=A0A138ZZW8_GONPJ|nr:hypothetical protein M427DRAFT_201343 [Gonapodya prolifera JEL478]|eukprot:KXS09958.1 hypothetical protein M427DRAFT_201343 [Gonapodya prolifera JEL478]
MSVTLPETYKRLVIARFSPSFAKAADVQVLPTAPLLEDLKKRPDAILVKITYTSPRASDRNDSNGNYGKFAGLPFPAGYEGVGEVIAVAPGVKDFKAGDAVGLLLFSRGGASEYLVTTEDECYHIPSATPPFLTFFNAGLTAIQGLFLPAGGHLSVLPDSPLAKYIPENVPSDPAQAKPKTVLITAAAGGVGVMASQFARLAGHKVIGVAGGPAKVEFLLELKCAKAINYKEYPTPEALKAAILEASPEGVDVVWDTIGGETAVAMAQTVNKGGRQVVIGKISEGYGSEEDAQKKEASESLGARSIAALLNATNTATGEKSPRERVREILAVRGGELGGFLMTNDGEDGRKRQVRFAAIEVGLWESGLLTGYTDDREGYVGLDKYPNAVEYLHAGKNMGKIVVKVQP